ncbi:MAG: hypothetical protein HY722_06290 [Planctomycetes bacterium]|nr:hypothetical protein [Planctomycetota bacterium]
MGPSAGWLVILVASPPLLTAACGALALSRGTERRWRRLSGWALILGYVGLTISCLPEDPAARFGILVLGAGTVLGNLTALEHRLRHGRDGWGPYLVDELTLSSRRLTAHLRPVAPGPALALARGLAFGGVASSSVLLLGPLAPEALPYWLWIYLKMISFACGAQALSDLLVAACLGRVVPLVRMPILATSYEDFWGRRYNLWVHGFLRWAARDALGLGRRPVTAVVAAFALSGALHELLSTLVLRELKGYWSAFWAVQLALTLGGMRLRRLRRRALPTPLAVALMHATMLPSAPLFFAVLDRCWNPFGVPAVPW